ncbi:MAG: YHYH protein [Saprospiraceae bacterium]|nr:YHYH protein [Saprospiraceae bacterium]
MKYLSFAILVTFLIYSQACKDDDSDCMELIWYQDADSDGLGNPAVSLSDCEQPQGYVSNNSDTDDSGIISASRTPESAFDDFNDEAVVVSFDGNEITIESNGLPNHTSPYWDSSSDMYIDPVVAVSGQMSPGTIRSGSYSLTVPAAPVKASTPSSTGLGAIGIAVTGVPIFNDEEGPNIALSAQVASGFDYAGGHMGPTGYHYHLESSDVSENTLLSHNDHELVGILQDGFLIYGRKCSSTNDYPTDLDASGGHTSSTHHSGDDQFYHYHIINEFYLDNRILLFGVDLQGTPNAFAR